MDAEDTNSVEGRLKEETDGNKGNCRGGGTACCVPECGNNTKRNPDLSFHKFPKDAKLRKTWVHWVGRDKSFVPNEHHKVCSSHFPGGKKTYMNNIPYETPKVIKPKKNNPRPTFKCRKRLAFSEENKENSQDCSTEEEGIPEDEDPETVISRLQHELDRLRLEHEQQVSDLKNRLQRATFSIEKFKNCDSDFEFYTGFQNYSKFKSFVDYLSPACNKLRYVGSNNGALSEDQQKRGKKRCLCPEEELFMVLSRLRCGLLERDLAIRYDISVSQVSNIWITWINFIHQRLRAIDIWPSRALIDRTMPQPFKEYYPNTRVIIDCTEIFIEKPSAPGTQSATFSTYKHHNTAKALIGISPAGKLTFASELYAGKTSDKELTNDCGLLHKLEPGDQVMADRGFNIEADLPVGVSLNIPPFLNGQPQLSVNDEVKTRRIAKQRIHVERAIEKIKNFRILHQVIPLSMAADINKIWGICSYLTLFFKPLVVCAEQKSSDVS